MTNLRIIFVKGQDDTFEVLGERTFEHVNYVHIGTVFFNDSGTPYAQVNTDREILISRACGYSETDIVIEICKKRPLFPVEKELEYQIIEAPTKED